MVTLRVFDCLCLARRRHAGTERVLLGPLAEWLGLSRLFCILEVFFAHQFFAYQSLCLILDNSLIFVLRDLGSQLIRGALSEILSISNTAPDFIFYPQE